MARATTLTGKPTASAQVSHVREEFILKAGLIAVPWGVWGLVSLAALALRAGFARYRWLEVLLFLGAGALVTGFDWHMRRHRATLPGRFIGPVTCAAAVVLIAVFMVAGYHHQQLLMVYGFGGAAACLVWDIWLMVGDVHDRAKTMEKRSAAAGVAGAQLYDIRTRPAGSQGAAPGRGRGSRPGRGVPQVTEAGLVLPTDPQMSAEEAADRIAQLEAVNEDPPGSWSISHHDRHSGLARVRIADPGFLTAAPIPWPGPSVQGEDADMSAPFRVSVLQDGREFLCDRTWVDHRKVTGMTGSGKTMSLAYNFFGEGFSRRGYAVLAADLAKGEQFLGPARPALHRFETTLEGTLDMLAGLHRARLARCNYLGAMHLADWTPDCGLSFLECWLEEAGTILRHLGTTRQDRDGGLFMLEDWEEDVNTGRSAGMSWTASYQKAVIKSQARSGVARSQMGHVCFGVADRDDAQFGLSDRQLAAGCRPQLWGRRHPGMAYFDSGPVPEEDAVMMMRFFDWGPGTEGFAAYAQDYPWKLRPLDEVTGEALEARPPAPATSTDRPVGGRYDKAGRKPPPAKPSPAQAIALVRDFLHQLRDDPARPRNKDGLAEVTARDLNESGVCDRAGRSRSWLYGPEGAMAVLEDRGVVEYLGDKPVMHWAVLGPLPRDDRQDEEPDEDQDPEEGT